MKAMTHSRFSGLKQLVVAAACIALLSGCSTMAPQYQSDFEVINTLKDIPLAKMQVGDFVSATPELDKVSIRGGSLVSPFGGSYSLYLQNALAEELKQSSLWDKDAESVVSGELLQNDFDASGINIGTADLSARFRVDKNGTPIYDKVHSVHHQWDSSFLGNVAIPHAINNYPIAVQKLISEFLLDIELLRAVKK